MLQERCSKHNVRHREQISPGVKVEQHGGMESLQIYLSE
jgi:hypothetical protein